LTLFSGPVDPMIAVVALDRRQRDQLRIRQAGAGFTLSVAVSFV
jgi:hypothetical protein